MAVIINSDYGDWWETSHEWQYVRGSGWLEKYLKCLETINEAKSYLDEIDDIDTIDVTITKEEIEEIYAETERFLHYCNGIHYEISELVDNVFSVDMGAITESIIDLNPNDYKILKSQFFWKKDYLYLSDIISTTITDSALQASFIQLADSLNTDSSSYGLEQSIKVANFWKEQFELAEKVDYVTDEFFTPELRAEWPNMSEERRKAYVEEYKNALANVYQIEGVPLYSIPVQFNETIYTAAFHRDDSHIGIRPEFVTNPTGEYSLDILIDNMNHEIRHGYQRINANNPNFDLPDDIRYGWTLSAVSPRLEDGSYDAKQYMAYYTSPVEADAKAFAALSQDTD